MNKSKQFILMIVAIVIISMLNMPVLAADVSNRQVMEGDNPGDKPDSLKKPPHNMISSASMAYSQSSGGGETVVVTSGYNLDRYLYWPNTIEPVMSVQTKDSDIHSAELTLSSYDVDEEIPSACPGGPELDAVYFNGHYLGMLTGANNQWSTTTFIIDPSWVNGEVSGSPGINNIKVIIDTASQSCWAVETDWVQLIINAGTEGDAKIASISTDKVAYSSGDTIDVALSLTTSVASQPVRLETNIYNPNGINIAGVSSTHTLMKNSATSVNKQLSIPSGSSSGEYTIEAIVYDGASVQQDKKTVNVNVGNEPDFYVNVDDITFSNVVTTSSGFDVNVDTSIHYENDATSRDASMKFYNEDILTGAQKLVHSTTAPLSQGVNTVSMTWKPSSSQHRLRVIIDQDNKIKETNENNNEAYKTLDDGPIINDVKSKYKGYFLSGISVDNTYQAFTFGNVNRVEFNMNGNIKTDSDGTDGWSMMYNMATLNSLFGNKLTITAYDANEISSKPFVVTPKIVNSPIWLVGLMNFGTVVAPWSATNLAHDNIIEQKFSIKMPKHPLSIYYDVPSSIVGIPLGPLSGKYGISAKGELETIFKSDGYSGISIGGDGVLTVADHEGAVGLSGKASPYINNNDELKLGTGNLEGYGGIKVPVIKQALDFLGIKGKFIFGFMPKLTLSLNFVESVKDTVILGMGWDPAGAGGVSISTPTEAIASTGAGGIGIEGLIGVEPKLSAKVASATALVEFDKFVASAYAKIYGMVGWAKVKVLDVEGQWQYPPTASSLSMSLVSVNSITNGEWEPIPRDYATKNYAQFTAANDKLSGLNQVNANIFAINALGAYSETMLENIFPYANPSIATDNNGNAIMVWTHDDINKPQAQGFEIYYSKWDGNDWSAPGPITNNNLPEFDPDIKFDSNGNAIATWIVYNNSSITASTSPLSVLKDVEISYSVWNKTTSIWSTPKLVTSNSMYDNMPHLSSDLNGNISLVWILDKDNDIMTASDRGIYASYWNGSDWNTPELVANDIAIVDEPTIAYTNNNAISVWVQDMDNDITSSDDKDLYYATFDGNSWSTPSRITNDNVEDTMPTVMFDKSGNTVLSWVKTNETSDKVYMATYTGSWNSPEIVVESQLINEMKLAFDSKNNAVIIWDGLSDSSQDVFYTVRDNSNKLWSGEMQLTNDTLHDWQLSASIDSYDNLMIASMKRNMIIINRNIEGESDLNYLIHPIMLDTTLDSTDIVFSNENAYPGDTITITATIHNVGDLQANSVEVKFFDGISGPQIGTTQTISALPAGQNTSTSVTWAIPNLQQSHDIYVIVDPENKLPETNESNNIVFASIVLPDLQINKTDVTYSYENGLLRINATISNSGVISVSNVPIELFDEGTNGILLNTTSILSLSPSSNETISMIWDTQGTNSGVHNISVIIDRMDNIREQNETNNIANISLMVLPDLKVSSNNVTFSEVSEGNLTISATVSNIGISNAENITVEFFDGDPSSTGVLVGNSTIDSISVNSESNTEVIWYATAGQHDIYVQIDSSNLIAELDTSNNLALNPVTISPGTDLMLMASDISSEVSDTGHLNIIATIHNTGLADVLYASVDFYNGIPDIQTTNPYVTNIPNLIGTEIISSIPSKGYVIVSLNTNLMPMGSTTYDIYVKVDPKDDVHELNESNNMMFNRISSINQPPVASVDITEQTVQYSDGISPVTVSASDIDSTLTLTTSWKMNGGAEQTGLPDDLTLSSDSCITSDPSTPCTWTLEGNANVVAGNYNITFNVSDGQYGIIKHTNLIVISEDSMIAFDDSNSVAVKVAAPGGESEAFSLKVNIKEVIPDISDALALSGDINLAEVSISLVPVGPGPSVNPASCSRTVAGTGYDATLTLDCGFNDVNVNTYEVMVTVNGGYYIGSGENVLVVYDPSLGFTTGGGTFLWPETGEKTNFGYNMKYNKKGAKVQGSLLLVRHLSDGTIYRVKSNALYGLSIGEDDTYGWASFSGKATYREPEWLEPVGNHEFIVYVEDHDDPGNGADRFWIKVKGQDGIPIDAMSLNDPSVDNTISLSGGNIVVPHK